jgi:hypothetical protein
MNMKIMDSWEVMPCSLAYGYQCFGRFFCLHLKGGRNEDGDIRLYLNFATHIPDYMVQHPLKL